MKKYKSLDGQRQSVLWTVYHTILAVLLFMIVAIEFAELMIYLNQIKNF